MASPVPTRVGIARLSTQEVDLPPGVWTDIPVEVNLHLARDVHPGRERPRAPGGNRAG